MSTAADDNAVERVIKRVPVTIRVAAFAGWSLVAAIVLFLFYIAKPARPSEKPVPIAKWLPRGRDESWRIGAGWYPRGEGAGRGRGQE